MRVTKTSSPFIVSGRNRPVTAAATMKKTPTSASDVRPVAPGGPTSVRASGGTAGADFGHNMVQTKTNTA
jgi:hypothetical protein